jgi:post-segregation antitoxin (ccd killing protein)
MPIPVPGANDRKRRLAEPGTAEMHEAARLAAITERTRTEHGDAASTLAISLYGPCMAAKKVTITLPEELVEALGLAAREDGVPLSRLVASAAESELRRRAGRQLVADWQAEHGAFTIEELAAARAEMAAADAEAFNVSGPAAA